MSGVQVEQGTAKPRFTTRLAMVVAHYGIVGMGYFGVLSVLVVALRDEKLTAGQVALCSSTFLISSKVAKIPLAVFMDRLRPSMSLLAGCWLAGAAFALLPAASSFAAVLAVLFLAGIGVSINALASKQVAAEASDGVSSRTTAFATINVAVNIASAVAAPVALFIIDEGRKQLLFTAIGGMYALAGTVSAWSLRSPKSTAAARPGWAVYREVIRTPHLWRLLMANAFGWFLYAQLFNALPLYVTESLDAGAELGLLFTANALLIIVLQVPLGHAFERITRGDADLLMALSFVTFGVAFLIGGALPGFIGLVALVVVFSTAEAMFVPSVDVSLLEKIDPTQRAAGYSVVSIATAVGETAGASAGLTVLAWMQGLHADRGFWLVAATVALMFAGVARWGRPARAKSTQEQL